jgi:gliding motility-associated-like protein
MKLLLKAFAALLFTLTAQAQYITVNDGLTPQELVEVLLGDNCTQISNVSYSGWADSSGNKSMGQFSGAGTTFPFQEGIMLTTGLAQSGQGPNMLLLGQGPGTWEGDADLSAALPLGFICNASVLEFDFVPVSNAITFNYIFSSEEYISNLQPNACHYTDGFAFLLKEAAGTGPYQNLALLPGTDIPVMITTVRGEGNCPPANQQYFGGYNTAEHSTNYNGQTVTLTAFSAVTPGATYHIKIVIADQSDTLYDSAVFLEAGSFTSLAYLGQDRLIATLNPLCAGEAYTVNALSDGASGYQWYKDAVAIPGETNPFYTITAAGTYTVDVQFGSCISQSKIVAEYAPVLPAEGTIVQCDDNGDGLTQYSFNDIALAAIPNPDSATITGYYLTEAAALAGSPQINTISGIFNNTAVNQRIYVAYSNLYGCTGTIAVTLATNLQMLQARPPLIVCDTDGTDDGLFEFNLTEIEAALLTGLPVGLSASFYLSYQDALHGVSALEGPQYKNAVAGGQILYARISNGPDCFNIMAIPLIIQYFFGVLEDEYIYLCDGQNVQIQAPAGMAAYAWHTTQAQTTRGITVSQAGTYAVVLTGGGGCSGTKTYFVLPSGAPQGADYEIDDFQGANNSLFVRPIGSGSYEFSLDGIRYQEAALFTSLAAGEYMLHVRDTNGCGPEYIEKVTILDYMRYFTPNGDGVKDIWEIPHLKSRPGLLVRVYDRFGKPVISFKGESGWDGTFDGKPLPATDYWFAITLENGRIVKGHFSLLR